MFKKMLLAGVFVFAFAAASFAADMLGMSLNFYAEGGKVAPVGALPAGVTMGKPIKFPAKSKLKGYAWPVLVDIEKAPSIDLEFKIEGNGELVVSLNPEIWVAGKGIVSRMTVKCIKFVLNGRPNKKVPFTFSKWTKATARGIMVEDGDTVSIKAEFVRMEED